ncbi:high-affinity fructose transporter ght6 [Schizosaccharomyces japonicus yFS275]|uniref:High-affinity fructose transporter ght6 n=1 Tax=Schizosaccharomyces japonicus (strain yFS275 / FY16936) TaxID=402676 RepID=B6K5U2_SCHJY|nr:high-affinity fructose transporter ght6 [Schizosaccharomyces japonicus yFS275]EEB08896.1 high-affinity fructose transporter ght6 [Schizosaccharomyces japonicus yFS275]
MGFSRKTISMVMLVFVSMAGWMFGADTGTIGGLTNMRDFQRRFADKYDSSTDTYSYSPTRQGLLVGMVNVGTLIGSLLCSPLADRVGKKVSIMIWTVVYLSGIVIQLTSKMAWFQFMIAKIWTGFSIGALSVLTPGYQSETSPASIRGLIVTSFQLFITLGIFVANIIVFGCRNISGAASWRVPLAINLVYGVILFIGMMYLPESPRYLMQINKPEECRRVLADTEGVDPSDPALDAEFNAIRDSIQQEFAGGPVTWGEIFGPLMRYRTFLGMAVMSFQQLAGANYFFYYGTDVFKGVGISNSFIASLILGAVNFGSTFPGLYVVENLGRRWPLIIGAVWMFVCFMVFSSVGFKSLYPHGPDAPSDKTAGNVMIIFSCLYIFAFACTWAPAAWVIVGESYPVRVRSKCASVATACNWSWNFLISFFTPFIVKKIGFKYGYVFACCCLCGALVIFFFACETKGLSLEEVNEMYVSGVKPWASNGYAKTVIRDRNHSDLEKSITHPQLSTVDSEENKKVTPSAEYVEDGSVQRSFNNGFEN